jgi:hypothetical protein
MCNCKPIRKTRFLPFLASLVFYYCCYPSFGQQIHWAKLYPLPDFDAVNCITRDALGNMYMGGSSRHRSYIPGFIPRAMMYKLDSEGDTLFSLWLGIYGEVQAMAVDKQGIVRVAVQKPESSPSDQPQLHLLSVTPEGFIFRRDTISHILYVNHSCIGKDSSWILCGYSFNVINPLNYDTYVQRIKKDGTIEPFITLSNNISEQARRVEQLPNGKYLVSGSGNGKVISYTFNEDLANPQPMQTWYQDLPANPVSFGHVSRINGNRFMVSGQAGPCIVGQVDSLKQKYWLHKQIGTQIPPQAMTDGSVVFGYLTSIGPPNPFYRIGPDSNLIWYISIKDSLIARGIDNAVRLNCFTFFEDESAVIAGVVQNPATSRDPIFIKISNVGTPVTSLSKPKKGPLQNETLAPWPNPSSGTLYLKQHFDKAEVRFYNLSGKEMAQYQIRFGQPIELSALPSGLYLYRAVIDGKSYSGKVVKR